MMEKKHIFMGVTGLACALAIVALAGAGVMYCRVRAFNAKHKCDVWAGLSAAELRDMQRAQSTQTVARAKASAARDDKKRAVDEKAPLVVRRIEQDDDDTSRLRVIFNKCPDMDVARNYIQVEPLIDGELSFWYSMSYNYTDRDCCPTVTITGNYAYRTNVTLRIRKGFPLDGKCGNSHAEGSLTNDFVHVFRRKDPRPSVAFADKGRYLPPGGGQALRVEAVSVTNIATEIYRVEPRNVVQLLAREESQYRRHWWSGSADEEDTVELSGVCETGVIRCVNRPCEKETCRFPVKMADGGSPCGIFLAAIRNGDCPRREYHGYYDEESPYNPNYYRLVCLSDLGLSVRTGAQMPSVWVTSLTTGRPVAGACVEIYSPANILLAAAQTNAKGWCEPKLCAKGTPFAVVVRTPSDMTFLALRDGMTIDETCEEGTRPAYLSAKDVDAFVWTERGIYRHGEPIFVQTLVRDALHKAPKPMPITLKLKNPMDDVWMTKTLVADNEGSLIYEGFTVPAEQPSGTWSIRVGLPGEAGTVLAEREIKIEEFAPPQIRVSVTTEEAQHPTNFTFTIAAEHLFGGPAQSLACEGAVVFEDVPFAPKEWKGFTFGNENRGLRPCFRYLSQRVLDDRGTCEYHAPLWADSGLPKAMVRATGQGVVFEDGGRPATARNSILCHYYPFYIGSNLPSWLKRPPTGLAKIDIVCVDTHGQLLASSRKLVGKIDRIDSVYSYRPDDDGRRTWGCDRVRTTLFEAIPISVNDAGRAEYELPLTTCGDYVLTIEDPVSGTSFGRTFYFSDWGDDVVRAPLSDPTAVSIRPDKAFYRVGERPRLVVKSPFAGFAIMSVMRDDRVYDEVVNLTNATSEVVLRPVARDWAPNVDVAISVVQSVRANARHLAARAHGRTTVRVRPLERELDVALDARVTMNPQRGGSRVAVDIRAPRATMAVVTLVDEGINLLTGEVVPDPVGWLARARDGKLNLYDLYHKVLPVVDDGLKANGVKTGGGFGAEMLGRVSPVPTRRFKPIALWNARVPIQEGKGQVAFDLPEFVGEVRVTAVAYSAMATGAAAVQRKVAPKLIMQPDAPRFAAPGDAFDVTLTLRNTTAEAGSIRYAIQPALLPTSIDLAAGASTNVVCRLRAPTHTGEMAIQFHAEGLGERHQETLPIPVRPAIAWRERAGMQRLDPGSNVVFAANNGLSKFALHLSGTPMAELASALEWLSAYPHGCLEQTASRIFPLITAGGILNAVSSSAVSNREAYVSAGVRRVESMIRESDFVMWPDCTCAPWDSEVSLYAAHFLIEAERAGQKLDGKSRKSVIKFLREWAMSTNSVESAYACHTLALAKEFGSVAAGYEAKDRMLELYDQRERLSALSRARLARAFAAAHDRKRAEALMAYAFEPQSIREAAFRALALLDLNPDDVRIPGLIAYLTAHRDKQRFHWGTTAENAHALLAIGAYYQYHPIVAKGEAHAICLATGPDGAIVESPLAHRKCKSFWAESVCVTNDGSVSTFLAFRQLDLPEGTTVTNEANGLFISRRYWRPNGSPADLGNLKRGEMLVVELTITSDVTRVVGDLVIEDLFAGAFEPVHRALNPDTLGLARTAPCVENWVMRKDACDDRMLVFSKKFELKKGYEAKVFYPVRVVSAGDFILPGPSVEGMYNPLLHARRAPGRLVVCP